MIHRLLGVILALLVAALPARGQGGVLRGTVVDDSTNVPIAGAEVVIDGGAATATTDAEGRFAFAGVSPGTHVVTIRKVGYSPLTTEVAAGETRATDIEFGLVRNPVVLDEVQVKGQSDPLERGKLSSFTRHRASGIGTHLTRELFDSTRATRTSDILQVRLPGARIVRSPCGLGAFIATSRFQGSLGGTGARAVVCGQPMAPSICLAMVLLDGATVYRGMQGEAPFDVNTIHPGEIAAVEFYAGPSQIPAEYNPTSSTCALIAIWTK